MSSSSTDPAGAELLTVIDSFVRSAWFSDQVRQR